MRDADPISILQDDAFSKALGVVEFLRIQAGGAYDPEEDDEFFRGYFLALEYSANMMRNMLLHDKTVQPSKELVDDCQQRFSQLMSDDYGQVEIGTNPLERQTRH